MKMTETTKPAPSRAAVLAQLLSWFEKNIASGTPIVPIEFGEIDGVPIDSAMAAGALRGNACGSAPKVVVYIDSSAVTHVYSSLPGMEIVVHDSVAMERDGFNRVRRNDILDRVTDGCDPVAFVDSFNALKGLA